MSEGFRPLFRRDPLADPERLVSQVFAYVAYHMGHRGDADDVTGEVFARAVRYRDSYDPSKGSPGAWLIGIARRCVEDALSEPVTLAGDPPEVAAGGDLEQETVDRVDLQVALGHLGARDRELIALRYGADLTARQIARHLDMQTNAVEVALHRALRRLRGLLESEPAVGRPPWRRRSQARSSSRPGRTSG